MELDDTQDSDEVGLGPTLDDSEPRDGEGDSAEEVEAKLAALRERRGASDIDGHQRKAMVVAGLFGGSLEPVKIGRLTIVRKLGAGGMGVVYVAYDESLDRRVAVKLLHGPPSPEARARFEREAQAMARLSHPNVVTVHEVGTHEDQIFVTMEFVEGQDLRDWMKAERRDWRALVELFRQAGEGLAAAHEAGIVHRDFKPDNVLVGKDGRVRVADFGLAHGFGAQVELSQHRAEDSQGSQLEAELTRTGAMMGTPAYMAPEQYAGQRSDARGDQFSFCVALWEGLYGQRPFSGGTLLDLSLAITEGDLDEPEEDHEVPQWLRAIVLRGLAPEPADRWPSMRALLDAIGDDPGVRRRRVLFGLGLVVGALTLLGAAWLAVSEMRHNTRQHYWNGLTEHLLEIERERGFWQFSEDTTRARDTARMSVGRSYRPKNGVVPREDATVVAALLREVEGEMRTSPEWISAANEVLGEPIARAVLSGHGAVLGPLVFSPDSHWLYSGADDGEIRRWELATGRGEVIIEHERLITQLALSPDGELLASSSEDGSVRLWSVASGESRVLARHDGPVTAVVFDASGRLLASGSKDGSIRIHELESGGVDLLDAGAGVLALDIDPTGTWLLAGSDDAKARLWRVGEITPVALLEGHEQGVYFVRHLGDTRALTAADDGVARLWQLGGDAPESVVVARHAQAIAAMDVHGSQLVTSALDGSVLVTSLDPPHESHSLPSHAAAVWSVSFTPDRQSVVSASFDRSARLARADGRGAARVFAGHRAAIYRALVDPTGRWMATGSYDFDVRLWDLQQPRLALPLGGHEDTVFSVEVDASGTRAVTASHDGTARVWSLRDGTSEAVLDDRDDLSSELYSLNHAVFSPGGQLVATARASNEVSIWDLSNLERRVLRGHEAPVWRVAFDPDGRRLVSASNDGTARIWEVDTGEELLVLRGHEARVFAVEFVHDGAQVLSASWDGSARVWDASTGAEIATLSGHEGRIFALARSPDDRVWATGSDDGTARLWSADLAGEPLVLPGHAKAVWSIVFDPGGERVVTASGDGRARVWSVADGRLLETFGGHAGVVWDAEFVAKDRLVTASGDGGLRVWSLGSDEPPIMLFGHQSDISSLAVDGEGRRLVSASSDGMAKLWHLDLPDDDADLLLERLRESTSFCLPVERRRRELGETLETARIAAEACARMVAR